MNLFKDLSKIESIEDLHMLMCNININYVILDNIAKVVTSCNKNKHDLTLMFSVARSGPA